METYLLSRARNRSALVLMLACTAVAGFSQSTTWKNSAGGNFTTGANWNHGLPNQTTDANLTNVFSGDPVVVGLAATTAAVKNLQLASNYTLAISSNGILDVFGATIDNAGTIELNGASTLRLNGDTTLQGGGTVTLNSDLSHSDAVILQISNAVQHVGTLALTNGDNLIQGSGTIGVDGIALVNGAAGTLLANGTGQPLLIDTTSLTNNGTMQANAGSTLQMASTTTFSNFSKGTLTGGTYIVNGADPHVGAGTGALELNLGNNAGGEITTNAATIIINGPTANARFEDANGNLALTKLGKNTGSLTIEGGNTFTTQVNLDNEGSVTIGTDSTLQMGDVAPRSYSQGAGTTTIMAGATLAAGAASFTGGNLEVNGTLDAHVIGNSGHIFGSGTIHGNLTNDGLVTLDNEHPLFETGDFTQGTDGTLEELIGLGHGTLDVTGNVDLDGALDIERLHGPRLFAGELFDVIDFTGTETGSLSLSTQDQQDWTVIYGANQVDLEFTPPVTTHGVPDTGSTVLLLGAAITCLGLFARTGRLAG